MCIHQIPLLLGLLFILCFSFIHTRYRGPNLNANATNLEPNSTHIFRIWASTSAGSGESRNFTAITKQLGNYYIFNKIKTILLHELTYLSL